MDKEKVAFVTVEYYSARKDKFESFGGKQMYLETIMLREINQTHNLKYCTCSLK